MITTSFPSLFASIDEEVYDVFFLLRFMINSVSFIVIYPLASLSYVSLYFDVFSYGLTWSS